MMEHVWKRRLRGVLGSVAVIVFITFPGTGFSDSSSVENIRIKGLYIGMTLSDAKAIAQKYADVSNYELRAFNLSEYRFRKFQYDGHRYWFADARKSVVSPIAFATDSGNRISFVSIQGALVDELFNSGDHTAEQLVGELCKVYHIQDMTEIDLISMSPLPKIMPEKGWTYSSANGYRITVFSNKDIDIEKTDGKRNETPENGGTNAN